MFKGELVLHRTELQIEWEVKVICPQPVLGLIETRRFVKFQEFLKQLKLSSIVFPIGIELYNKRVDDLSKQLKD